MALPPPGPVVFIAERHPGGTMTTQTRRGFIQGAGALAATMALPLAAQNVIPIRVANPKLRSA